MATIHGFKSSKVWIRVLYITVFRISQKELPTVQSNDYYKSHVNDYEQTDISNLIANEISSSTTGRDCM